MAENDPEAGSRFVQFSLALSCREVQEADGEEREESGTSKVQSPPLGLPGLYRSKMTRFQRSPRLSSTDARPGPNVGCCSCMHSSEAKVVVFLLGKRQTPRFDRFSSRFAKATPASQQPACFRIINFSGALSCIFVPASGSRGPVGS